ncbi:protein serine/threonine kinase, putative [Entamoeba invadens IP1]|uniref:Protein serine/threonine kinase, putative n=1 Tax=Entamoeba invadens IP1 TaxID=370355 RepID=A0A0A1U399_ENTIV|nr:protein serine/threonine kinase, putative [Entamoeba invadens IP1]ELP86086.1 protein serine/threonine kinase, putative [Entamoeba invadens IP1]|eukprot:XP_004185432.1 protein serine/threonine kinase, putative [Entamoeba invadens IP1]
MIAACVFFLGCVLTVAHDPGCSCTGYNIFNQCNSCSEHCYQLILQHNCYSCSNPFPGCLDCYRDVKCLVCKPGYYLSNKRCTECTTYDSNCITCDSSRCLSCNNSLVLSNDNRCVTCGVKYEGCTSCTQNACNSCSDGYYLLNGLCVKCGVNCDLCTSTTCTRCNSNQLTVLNGICQKCNQRWTACTSCDQDSCFTCDTGYYRTISGCVKCGLYCNQCVETTTSSICETCQDGYYIVDGKCVDCSTRGCSICTPDSCSNCVDNFYIKFSECVSCHETIDQCKKCGGTAISPICEICEKGYYTLNGKCQKCSETCGDEGCTQLEGNCIDCINGYIFKGGLCVLPSENQCTSYSDSNCTKCESGTIQVYDRCVTTSPCNSQNVVYTEQVCISNEHANCMTTILSQTALKCSTCDVGYLLVNSICVKYADYIPKCRESVYYKITNEYICSSCRVGFFPNAQKCEACNTLKGCLTCENNLVPGEGSIRKCYTCQSGYYVSNYQCEVIPNCLTNIDKQCTLCKDGFVLENSNCVSYKEYAGCLSSSHNFCTSCGVGFYLSSMKICSTCSSSNCESCEESGVCHRCHTNYTLSSPTTCEYCNLEGCELCDNTNNLCVSCNDLYHDDDGDGKCQTCSTFTPYCVRCKGSKCTWCVEKYYLTSNLTCDLCTNLPHCSECSRTTSECTSCVSNEYYLYSGNCLQCSLVTANCQTCSDLSTCTSCASGYFKENNLCKKCEMIHGCHICSTTTRECLECLPAYYKYRVNESDYCLSCSEIHEHCAACSIQSDCTECTSGYILSSGKCVLCTETYQNCATCSTKSNSCVSCTSDEYYLFNNVCYHCTSISKCRRCSSSYQCVECESNYYLSSGSCYSCTTLTGCTTCDSSGYCLTCKSGYYNLNGECDYCSNTDVGCSTCATTGKCLSCISGYAYKSGKCVSCGFLYGTSCKVCSSTQCTSCGNGNVLIDGNCYSCSTYLGCSTCSTSSSTCTACTDNTMSPSVTNTCNNCQINHCEMCETTTNELNETSTACVTCQFGYYLSSNICMSCTTISNCVECDNTKKCYKCKVGYYLTSSGTCSSCTTQTGCSECSSGTFCEYCKSDYYLENGVCKLCSTNVGCTSCSNYNTKCYACSSKYYLNSNRCISCSVYGIDCSTCTSLKCTLCLNNTVFDGTKCTSCSFTEYKRSEYECQSCSSKYANCYTCDANKCTQCIQNYSFKNSTHTSCVYCPSQVYNNECVSCSLNCELCTSPSVCIKCKIGYILRNGLCSMYYNIFDCMTYLDNFGCEECDNSITETGECSALERTNECSYYKVTQTNTSCNFYYTSHTKSSHTNNTREHIMKTEDDTSLPYCDDENKGRCLVCSYNYFLTNTVTPPNCSPCDESCSYCTKESSQCSSCTKDNSYSLEQLTCENDLSCEVHYNSTCYKCKSEYYISSNKCVHCSLEGCSTCLTHTLESPEVCLKCIKGYVLSNVTCVKLLTSNCAIIDETTTKCLLCNSGFMLSLSGTCVVHSIEDCEYSIDFQCQKCVTGKYLSKDNANNTETQTCSSTSDITCDKSSTHGCLRCTDGYYEDSGFCSQCSSNCKTCVSHSQMCLTCHYGYVLSTIDNSCVSLGNVFERCDLFIPNSMGCAFCKDGYYWSEWSCLECSAACLTCSKSGEDCLTCNKANGFYWDTLKSSCQLTSTLLHCTNASEYGCETCENGYYLDDHYCQSCPIECTLCNSTSLCVSCMSGYILKKFGCVSLSQVSHCVTISNEKCSSCTKNYSPSTDGTECLYTPNMFVFVGIPVIVIVVVIILLIIISFLIYVLYKHLKQKQLAEKTVTEFDIGRSNIEFIDVNKKCGLVSNKVTLDFLFDIDPSIGSIPVGQESRDLLCVGSKKSKSLKIQLSLKEHREKYSLRTNPQLITVNKNKAIEFELFLKPLCTMTFNETIMLVALDVSKGEEYTFPIKIQTKTVLSSSLDDDELVFDKEIGKGTFGIVYKGMFRGNVVAIKKMKDVGATPTQITDFEKEVEMLDKFRSDFLVIFYGACLIPNKICIVTEFAQYGSLNDCMRKRAQPSKAILNSFEYNVAKGIQYLHANDILHRDIKPDNILIFSIEKTSVINAKLTDFGSSRNINMLMTNMTFTKGIGTPTYMAPEILKKQKYKKSADVYSFGVTVFETETWKDTYPLETFKFPWKIAEFVTSGERMKKTDTMEDWKYNFISKCWEQIPEKRYSIDEIVEILQNKTI